MQRHVRRSFKMKGRAGPCFITCFQIVLFKLLFFFYYGRKWNWNTCLKSRILDVTSLNLTLPLCNIPRIQCGSNKCWCVATGRAIKHLCRSGVRLPAPPPPTVSPCYMRLRWPVMCSSVSSVAARTPLDPPSTRRHSAVTVVSLHRLTSAAATAHHAATV
jgi:hypothetical protein